MMGTVLFRTEVSPLEISFSANANKAAGSRALNRPRTKTQTRPADAWHLLSLDSDECVQGYSADEHACRRKSQWRHGLLAIWMSRTTHPENAQDAR